MRAIDADALKEDLTRFYDNEVTARKLIDEQPTILPEIVRCKDCKNYKFGMCMYSMTSGVGKSENGFCDWAERREVTT